MIKNRIALLYKIHNWKSSYPHRALTDTIQRIWTLNEKGYRKKYRVFFMWNIESMNCKYYLQVFFCFAPEFQWKGKYCVTLINIQPSISFTIFTKSNAYKIIHSSLLLRISYQHLVHIVLLSASSVNIKKITNILKWFHVHFIRPTMPAKQCKMSTNDFFSKCQFNVYWRSSQYWMKKAKYSFH